MNCDTPEYCAFQGCFDRLVNGLKHDVESVARKAFANNLISSDNLTNATNRTNDEPYRATKLLVKILPRIQENPACFDRFVGILKIIPTLEDLAQQLTSDRYHQQQLKEGGGLSQSPSINNVDSGSLCDLNQQQTAITNTDLAQNFTYLISQCINSCQITPKALANIILCLNLFDSESDMDESLVADCRSDLQQASSNAFIFEIVKPYMSPLNPELLGHIIEFLGTDNERKNFKKYLKALETSCKVTEAELLHHEADKMLATAIVFQQVNIVMEAAIGTLESVRNLQAKMAKILKVHVASLQIKVHNESPPVVCSFQLPKVAIKCERVFPLSNEQERALKALGLTSLKCGNYTFENLGAQWDKVSEEEIEMPCLGRLFHLGMFYDCQNDKLLDTQLCKDDVAQALEEFPQVSHSCEVLEDDSLETKALSLELTTSLKLSLMSNLIQNVTKSAKFWNDRCKSKRQVRISLKYTSTMIKKQLPTNNFSKHLQPKTAEGATHVVTGVLYGFNAFCVFDRMLQESERFEDVHERMLTMVKSVKVLSSSESTHIDSPNICTVYSDTGIDTLREVIDQFHKLNDLSAKEKPTPEPVPIKVWLYPLEKLDSRFNIVARKVSSSLADKVQSKLECLHLVQMLSNDLLAQYNVTFSRFQHPKSRVAKFIEIVKTYSNKLQTNIAKLLPEIRGERVEEIELATIIKEMSPFEYDSLKTWLNQVKEEISTLEMLMNQIKHVEFLTPDELQSIIKEPDSQTDYNVCLMFHVPFDDDQTISNLQSYLQPKPQANQCMPVGELTMKWYTSTELMKKITSNIKCFKTFLESNSENKRTKFVAVICTPTATQTESTSILLYDSTSCKPWEPPGPPGKPTAKNITHDTVQLEWSIPEYGSQSVDCYKVSYYPVDQPQDDHALTTINDQPVATISTLAANTKYVFTVQSKCKVGLGAKGETSDVVQTQQVPVTQEVSVVAGASFVNTQEVSSKPKATSITHNCITLEWPLPEESSSIVDCYTISYRKVDDTTQKWKKTTTNSSELTKIISNLSPQAKYIFKVRPELNDDKVGPWSQDSDSIETKPPPCQPGKPAATAVSHDSIEIQWEKPSYHSKTVHSYFVRYTMDIEGKSGWTGFMTDTNHTKFVASNLSVKTKYIFKVRPELEDDVGEWSDVSDPIETKGTARCASRSILSLGKPTAIEVTDKSIILQWKKPDLFNDLIDYYTVTYCSVDNPKKEWKSIAVTDTTREKITLNDLINDTRYVFKVRFECSSGNGASSELSDPIKTRATSSPGKPTASDVTCNSLVLHWSRPECGSEKIEKYKILYSSSSRSGDDHTETFLTQNNEQRVLVEKLSANTVYMFQVQPICSENLGCVSVSDTIRTKPTSPPGKPEANCVSHDSISLIWTKPELGGENTKYYTVKVKSDDGLLKEFKTEGTQEAIIVQHLDMKKIYQFKVCPECGEASTGMESELSAKIETMAASPPGKPTVNKVTHNSVQLEWIKPEKQCGNIVGFEVWYRITGKTKWEKVALTGPTEYKTNIGQEYIDFDSEYEFKVVPICSSGNGSKSETSEPVRTLATTPPGRPIASAQSPYSVHLKWTKPKHRGDLRNIKYNIVCKEKKTDIEFEKNVMPNSSSRLSTEDQVSTSIGGLTHDTEYIFRVQPDCPNGLGAESEWSQPVKTKPIYYKPGKPQAELTKYDGASLKWERPDNGWEDVKYYIVHYQNVTDSIWVIWPQKVYSPNTQCSVSGLLPATSYIFKVESNLIISDSVKSNNVCKGTESENSELCRTKATTPPHSLEGFLTTVNNQHVVSLKWDAPENGCECIKHYEIKYTERSRQLKKDLVTIDGSKTTRAKIYQLEGKTHYTFTVIPVCHDQFEGEPSETITIETLPSCKPGKAYCVDSTYNKITIKWQKPEYFTGAVKQYELSYYSSSSDKMKHGVVPIKSHEGTDIKNLTNNTEYIFSVRPLCDGNISTEASVSGSIATMATSPPGKPLKSPDFNMTHNSVRLKWAEPAVGSENIKYYEIRYRKYSKLPSQIIKKFQKSFELNKTETNQQEATVERLSAGAKYIFKVRAVCISDKGNENYGMESDISDPIETNAISPPGKPRAIAVTHNSITLKWKRPKIGFITIEQYTIHCSVERKKTEVVRNFMRKDFEHQQRESSIVCTIPNLKPSTFYQFEVLPVGFRGSGSLSEISEPISTNSTGPPTKLRHDRDKVTHSSVHLQWECPGYGQELIDHYQLFYRKSGDSKTEYNWDKLKEKITKTDYRVENLEYSTQYIFKVLPICKDDQNKGTESEESDSIQTKPTSPPGKPTAITVTHNSIHLKWTRPTTGVPPDKYVVSYKSFNETQWKEAAECINENFKAIQLNPETKYRFVITPVCGKCGGTESELSDEITTKPVCKPGGLTASDITYDSITLTWTEPKHGKDNIDCYIVRHKVQNLGTHCSLEWIEQQTQGNENKLLIDELNHATQYSLEVCAKLKHHADYATEFSDPIQFTTEHSPYAISLCEQAQAESKLIRKGPPAIYDLPRITYTKIDEKKMIAKCHFGDPKLGKGKRERVLMLVGATGAGKSTLIECMVNYILGVKWEHDFRFQLIKQDNKSSQAESQTRYITAYTFYPVPGSALHRYTLTIIDTPGYGDTRGIQYDAALTEQIKEFFLTSPPHGIDHIDGVGFVTKAASQRLTKPQKYIYDSILKVFGKDMENNIFLMITFCDAQKPAVLEAIEAAGIPNLGHFKFNNSAVYANNSDKNDIISTSFWKMGFDTLGKFFTDFEAMGPRSLQLTRDTLEQREQLETLVEGLQRQITSSLHLIRELKREEDVITAHRLTVDSNSEPFTYDVEVMKGYEEPLPDEKKKVTICLKCRYTCHYPCTISNNDKKYNCAAMKGNYLQRNKESCCVVCPGNCHWNTHVNRPYRYVLRVAKETRTLQDLIKKYSRTTPSGEQLSSADDILSGVTKQLDETFDKVLDLITQAQESINKLDQIALRKSESSSQVAYIELLIEAEKQSGKPGYKEHIKSLEKLRETAAAKVALEIRQRAMS